MTILRRTAAALLTLVCLSSSAHLSWADGVIRDGVGAISSGRGGTNLGFADNGAIVLENPAGMVNMNGNTLSEVGVDVLMTDLRYSDPEDAVGSVDKPYPLPFVSVIRKSDDGQWAWGLGIFAPAGFGAEYDLVNTAVMPGRSQYRYKSFGALGKIAPSMAYQVNDRLSVGGYVGLGISHAELEGPFYLQTGPMSGMPTILDLQATGAALSWGVGIQYALTPRTMLGVMYTGQTNMTLEGNARVDVAGLGQSEFDADVELGWPRSLGIGVAHSLAPGRRIASDVIWFNWSEAFDGLDLMLRDPENPMFAAMVGSQVRDRFPLNWRDTISVRLGYEHDLDFNRTARVGYVYHRNPVPNSTLTPFIPGILEHAVSAGYEHRFQQVTLNLAYQYSFGRDQAVDTSGIVGDDFSSSLMEASAHWAMISLKWQY